MIILNEKLRLLRYIKLSPLHDTSYGLIKFISKHIRHSSDIVGVNLFFLRLYDELYHEILFKKLKIQKKVLRIFESLAIPVQEHSEKKLNKICYQIKKVKSEMEKERRKKRLKDGTLLGGGQDIERLKDGGSF